jgi:hypothetical protein
MLRAEPLRMRGTVRAAFPRQAGYGTLSDTCGDAAGQGHPRRCRAKSRGAPLSMSTVRTRRPRSPRRVRHPGSARLNKRGRTPRWRQPPATGAGAPVRRLRLQLRRRLRTRNDLRGKMSTTACVPTAAREPRRHPGRGGGVHRPASSADSPAGTSRRSPPAQLARHACPDFLRAARGSRRRETTAWRSWRSRTPPSAAHPTVVGASGPRIGRRHGRNC